MMVIHPFQYQDSIIAFLPAHWDTTKLCVSLRGGLYKSVKEANIGRVVFAKSNLPTIFIQTSSGTMDYINRKKSNEENGWIMVVDTLGIIDYEGELESIHGRGNQTWQQEKKPYSIKLSQKTKILGVKKAKKFNLLSQPFDPTGLRNYFCLTAAKQMGLNENMDFTFVNLYLNGNYAGCYLITNKVDREIRNDYLLEIDYRNEVLRGEDIAFQLNRNGNMIIKKPKKPSKKQVSYIKEEWEKVENTLFDYAGNQDSHQLENYIDICSFVNNYLCQEVFMNLDAGTMSFYLCKDSLGKFYANPLWDMDISLNCPYSTLLGKNLCRIIYAGAGLFPDKDGYKGIFGMLYNNLDFKRHVYLGYNERMKPVIHELFLGNSWIHIISSLKNDMTVDNLRWRNGIDYDSQCKRMRTWMQERLAFLDWVWNNLDNEEIRTITLMIPNTGFNHSIQYVLPKNTQFREQLPDFNLYFTSVTKYEYKFAGYEMDGKPLNFDTFIVNKNVDVFGMWEQIKEPSSYQKLKNRIRESWMDFAIDNSIPL